MLPLLEVSIYFMAMLMWPYLLQPISVSVNLEYLFLRQQLKETQRQRCDLPA